MKTMHKLLALLVVLAMVFSMTTMALAANNETELDFGDNNTTERDPAPDAGDDDDNNTTERDPAPDGGDDDNNTTERDPADGGDDNTGDDNTGDDNTGDNSGNTGDNSGNTGDNSGNTGNGGDNETELDPDTGDNSGNTGSGDNDGDNDEDEDEDEDENEDPTFDWLGLGGSGYDFLDVTYADWFYEDVQYVCGEDLMEGIGGDKFGPDNQATRAMIVTILWRMEGEPEAWGSENFSDIGTSRWYTTAVKWAASNGIVGGYGDGEFGPDDSITREQLAAILYRYAQYKGYDVNYWAGLGLGSYGDAAAVSEYAVSALEWAVGAELVNGMGGNLNPAAFATRAQIAAIFHRFCEMY